MLHIHIAEGISSRTCAASIVRMVIFFQVGDVLAEHFNDETCEYFQEAMLVRSDHHRLHIAGILLDGD